jgi:Flavodoxin reductases (ferredoxin-NADPH reductases) family 1
MSAGDYIQVELKQIIQQTDSVKTLVLQPVTPAAISYKAGQFLTFAFAHNGDDLRRSYSFSSSPESGDEMAITVKRVANGIFSRKMVDTAKTGQIFTVLKPSGLFVLPDSIEATTHLVFFAAGVGITPIFSLIKTALTTRQGIRITLLYSNRSASDAVFYEELGQLQQLHPNFHIIHLFSTAPNLSRARLNKELVPVLLAENNIDISNSLFYICGPFAYMRMVLLALEEAGVPVTAIRKENFNTDVITRILQPPDTGPHEVTILRKGGTYRFSMQYPDTILKAAARHNVSLPYSCENGICGSCMAHCTTGRVWHRNNEVLTDAELQKGMILTCVGYPIGGNITLEL